MYTIKKSWKGIGLLLLIALPAMVLGIFCPLPVLSAPQTLKVVMDDNYPPYVFRDAAGELVGVLVDQWRLWEKKTGVAVEISAKDWARAQQEMQAGRYDVIDTIFKNPEREKLYDFSRPYTRLDTVIFFNKNLPGITGLESLRGFNVGVKSGGHSTTVLRQAGISGIVEFKSYEEIIRAARDSNLLIFIMEKSPGLYFLFKNGLKDEIRFSEPLYFGEFHRAVQKGNAEKLRLVEKGFSQISRAELETIDRKWFGANPADRSVDYRFLMIVIGVIVAISLLLALWNWVLRRSVRRKTAALAASETKYRELMTNLSIGVIVHDANGLPAFWNKAALRILGLKAEQLTGESALPQNWEYVSVKSEPIDPEQLPVRLVLATGEPLCNYVLGIRQSPPSVKWFQVDAFPDFREMGDIEQIVVTFFDITDRREAEEKLLFISFHDALTGVYNRAYFEEELRRLDERRSGAVAIAVADVDGMKQVNDTWGHAKGDELLIRVANILRKSVRSEDVVARIGGDEFAIILRNADEAMVAAIFERLNHTLEIENQQEDTAIPLLFSLGYAYSEDPDAAAVTLFQAADNRMYQDKARRGGARR